MRGAGDKSDPPAWDRAWGETMKTITTALIGTLALGVPATAAHAGSELMPGISTGIPMGVPLPEGVYSITIPTYGSRDSNPRQDVTAVVPAWLIWSTPWTIAGGRLLLDTVMPYVDIDVHGGPQLSGFANPFLDAQLKWDLGGGFFGGFQAGVYLPIDSDVGHDWAAFQGVAALSYLKDGWNLTSTFIFGTGRDGTDGAPSWFNVDLTATKKFGKFEIGAVAFGSTDLNSPYFGYAKQSQFAAGGLIGYDFDIVNIQLKLTTDLYEENYGGNDTRVWANITIPLWNPAASGHVVRK